MKFADGPTFGGPVFTIERSAEVARSATVMLQLLVAVTGGNSESVALVLKFAVAPVPVGVPAMVPVDEFTLKPAGRDPELIKKLYGAVPPVTTCAEL